MNKNVSRTNKWARFIVGTSAALAVAPQAMAAEQSVRGTTNIEALSVENAQLRKQLAEMQKKLDQLAGGGAKAAATAAPTKATENPFAMKELVSGYANASTTGQAQSDASKTTIEKKAGEMSCGAKMMKGGEMSCGANMVDMSAMEPGSQMQMNPILAGMDFFHIHPKGMWMFNTKFMHVNQSGLASGTSNVPINQVLPDHFGVPSNKPPYNYMNAPTYMTMDMFMLMPMVGITDRLSVMAMANYMTMEMGMKMGMGVQKEEDWTEMAPMRTSGFSDTELDATYAITKEVFATLGLSIPTGSIKQQVEMMGIAYRAPYDMQNGTGTFALKPALSYHHVTDDVLWMWGGQATYTGQLGTAQGYTRSNNFKLTTFLQRAFGPATGFLQMTFNDTGKISGFDPEIAKINRPMFEGGASMPDADPNNYGGQRLDAQIGFAYEKGPFSAGVSGGVPIYQYLNGLQLKTTWMLNAGFQAMF